MGLTITTQDGLTASSYRWVDVAEVNLLPPVVVPPVKLQRIHSRVDILAFATQPGVFYRIQISTTLDADDWTNHGDPLVGTGEEVSFIIENGLSSGPVFYRIVINADAPVGS